MLLLLHTTIQPLHHQPFLLRTNINHLQQLECTALPLRTNTQPLRQLFLLGSNIQQLHQFRMTVLHLGTNTQLLR